MSQQTGVRDSLGTSDQDGLKDFWDVYDAHYEEVQEEILNSVGERGEVQELLRAIPPEQRAEQSEASRSRSRAAVVDGDWGPHLDDLRGQGALYARRGVPFGAWFAMVGAFRPALRDRLLSAYGDKPRKLQGSLDGMNQFIDASVQAIAEGYMAAREETIQQQQVAMEELSTPVLQVRERLLILPIVGVVDSQRARKLTEHLLHAIRARRAKAVVLDVTGVPNVDSEVANHLLQTAQAARLMGATAIVTGLSAEVAQTLVTLGVDLSTVNTVGDLQGGIDEADRLLGYRVVVDPDVSGTG